MLARYMYILITAALLIQCGTVIAQDEIPKSIIAIVGDTDRFNIGQDGFCGERTEITSPSGKKFRIPSNKQSFFYVQSRIRTQMATYVCEGDYSFVPLPGMLHVIRYTMSDDHCLLQLYQSEPGATPKLMKLTREEPRSCLFK